MKHRDYVIVEKLRSETEVAADLLGGDCRFP